MDIVKFLSVVIVLVILYSVQATSQIIGEVNEAMRCVEKLMPCRPYIHSTLPPPPQCCSPMKEIAEKDVKCLCAVFNHPDMLRFGSLTKENALNLLKSCGANHNVSRCTNPARSSSVRNTRNAALATGFLGLSFVSVFMRF